MDWMGRHTVEVWSGKSLYNSEAEEEVSRGDPAFGNDIPRKEMSSETGPDAGQSMCEWNTDSLKSGITTGPPPKMIVPARYRFAKRLNPRGLFGRTPRKTMMTMKVTKKAAIRVAPNFQEKTRISSASGTILSCSSSSGATSFPFTRDSLDTLCGAVAVSLVNGEEDAFFLCPDGSVGVASVNSDPALTTSTSRV